MKIQPIVEGHGEVAALPILLRRLCEQAGKYVDIGKPIRRRLSELNNEDGIHKSVNLAKIQKDCKGILILFDSEDECPREKAPRLHAWALQEAGGMPCQVVLAYREYETWFLASIESLRGKYGIATDAEPLPQPESRRGAKEALEEYMPRISSYKETFHQPKLTACFDLASAYRRSRSFRKLVKAFGDLMAAIGAPCSPWPPPAWI